jgi:hypothetical protein
MLKGGKRCTEKNSWYKPKKIRQQFLDGKNMLEEHVHPDFDSSLGVLHSCNACRGRIKRIEDAKSEAMPKKKVYKPAKTPRTGRKRTHAPSAAHRKRWGAQQLRAGPAEWNSKCLHLFHMISAKRGSILFCLAETKVQAMLEAVGGIIPYAGLLSSKQLECGFASFPGLRSQSPLWQVKRCSTFAFPWLCKVPSPSLPLRRCLGFSLI